MSGVFHDRRDEVGDVEYPERVQRLYGAGSTEAMFGAGSGSSPTVPVPWQQAGRRRDVKGYEEDKVHALLRKPPGEDFREFDPRNLRATQPEVTRAGVDYYMGDEYRGSGRTFADRENVGNQFPVVYTRHAESGVQNLLLSGHHRAAAALLQGKQFQARHVEGGYGGPRR